MNGRYECGAPLSSNGSPFIFYEQSRHEHKCVLFIAFLQITGLYSHLYAC